MQAEKKVVLSRLVLIILCLGIFCTCFWQVNQTYDPLARYPYATDENREIILNYLDDDDIDYIITNQIEPDEFMDFIELPGFTIRNCRLYSAAKQTRDEDNEYIVNFVNRYRSEFSASELRTLLEHYSYVDLTTFYENDRIVNEDLVLVSDPEYAYVVLDASTSVYKYVPETLQSSGSIRVVSAMVSDLEQMKSAYSTMIGDGNVLDFVKGYTPYEEVYTEYTTYSTLNQQGVDSICLPAGQNEFQLGYTIALEGYRSWMEQLLQDEDARIDHDYGNMMDELDPDTLRKINWLEENAYRYGFVVRYPLSKEDVTGHAYNPFILRYVGKETAAAMHDGNLVMEEMTFDEELN